MPDARTAAYGSWPSPISSDMIVASSIGLGEILLDGAEIYWLEARPQEAGRSVLVRCAADGIAAEGNAADVTPPLPTGDGPVFSVRTRVHEYGGGAYLVDAGAVYFCNDADQRLYRQTPGVAPTPLTPEPGRPRGWRYADGVVDRSRARMVWVREDHTTGAREAVNTLVAIALDGARPPQILQSGRDFYAAPRLSPDGRRLAWLEWDHPLMPWVGCELWVGEVGEDGMVAAKCRIAGGDDESIFQPEWAPDGRLYFVSDRAQPGLDGRWWNLFRVNGDALAGASAIEPVSPLVAEFGRPQWNFRMSTYAFVDENSLVCSYVEDGVHRLARVDLDRLTFTPVSTSYQDISSVRAAGGRVCFRGGSPSEPPAIVALDLASGDATVLRRSTTQDIEPYRGYLSTPEPVSFDTDDAKRAHGLFYPPQNRDFTAPAGELPPLIVHCHGGPTAAASPTFSWGTQYWTSRGFAVLDVNYGGSTGYGREFRLRLQGNWGVVDVADCVNGARYLAEIRHAVDPERWAISGASAGGYTTLAVLTFRKEFRTGASYYGVSDLEALAKDTHKFESRYLDGLIGPYPERRDLYVARSPVHSARLLSAPVAFFQGAEDRVVPPEQAEEMVAALRRRRIPSLYLLFDGEQHGFRRADNIKRALDAELCFYATFLTGARLEFRASTG
ncbi:MAG TPA: prolyl oligopeptidase family serine peptidase [Stellaceae bacterium]|nr:prolyl oligopeptidase family serine peptidase [Stellaceae bacterium]